MGYLGETIPGVIVTPFRVDIASTGKKVESIFTKVPIKMVPTFLTLTGFVMFEMVKLSYDPPA